jgi:hypothetical protein
MPCNRRSSAFGIFHSINVRLDALYFYHFAATIKRQKIKSPIEDDFPIEKFRNEISRRIPSPLEIARLAATIAVGKQMNPQSATDFAAQALDLWEKSEEQRKKKINHLAMYSRARAIQKARTNPPRPDRFPASLDEVLKFLMPHKRSGDRLKFYREYIREKVSFQIWQEQEALGDEAVITPPEDQIARWIAADREQGVKEHAYYHYIGDFRRWLPTYEAENRQRRARAGAAGLKKKRENDGKTEKS